jgi:hypothetical protein
MAAPAILAALARRRLIFRASVAAATVLVMVGALAFSACVAALGIIPVDDSPVCPSAGPGVEPLSIGSDSQGPATLSARQSVVAGQYISVGKQLGCLAMARSSRS